MAAEGGGPSPSPVKLIVDTDPGVGAWRGGGGEPTRTLKHTKML